MSDTEAALKRRLAGFGVLEQLRASGITVHDHKLALEAAGRILPATIDHENAAELKAVAEKFRTEFPYLISPDDPQRSRELARLESLTPAQRADELKAAKII